MITTNTINIFLFFIVIWIGQIEHICGIPIIPPKAANNQNQNNPEAHRQLPPPQPPRPHQVPYHHQHPPSQNSNPEMEDFGRQPTNQNRFRRQAAPPEGKMTNGPFQQNPSEPFGNNYLFDEPQSNNNFRHQPYSEMPPDNYQQFDPHIMQSRHRYHNMPPPPSPPLSPRHPRHRDGHRDEFEHNQSSNDVFPEKNFHSSQNDKSTAFKKISERLFQSSVFQAEKGLTDTGIGALGGITRVRSEFAKGPSLPSGIPPPPATVTLIVLGPDGNSTLFIEYDVSDNDITYETTMEIEDMSDS